MDYESGKAIPNNQILSKIERILGKFGEQNNTRIIFYAQMKHVLDWRAALQNNININIILGSFSKTLRLSLCGFRKYQYSPHGRFFCFAPPSPQGIPV